MAYARKATGGRRRPARRRLTRVGRNRYTARGSFARTPTKRVTRRPMQRVSRTPFTAYALAHVDPFDDRCRGIKIPDANTMPSVALTLSQETTMAMTLGNANAHAFVPSPAAYEITAAVKNLGSNTWGWGATPTSVTIPVANQQQSAKFVSLCAGYDLVRTVAHGIRISCGLSPQTVTGFCHIAISARPTLNNFADDWFPKSVAEMSESTWYKRVPLATLTQRPLTVVNKILDTTQTTYASPHRGFIAEGTVNTNDAVATSMAAALQANYDRDSLNGFATIIVSVEGAPSDSSPLVIETIMHIEAIPRSIGLQTGSIAAPSRPDVLAGVSHMAATTPAEHFEGQEPGIIARSAAAFGQGAAAAAGNVADSFVNLAGQAGYAATRHAFGQVAGAFAGGNLPGLGPANRLMN